MFEVLGFLLTILTPTLILEIFFFFFLSKVFCHLGLYFSLS